MSHEKVPLRKGIRVAISIAVVLHLWAVILPPLGFQTRGPLGSSPSIATLASPVRGYGEMLYLNRGYAFFAPDPGPSHLVQASYIDAGGNRVEEMFPDRERHWPRLLYHRHFMLTEFLHEIYQPPGPPGDLAGVDPEAASLWAAARRRYETVRQSYTDHLNNSRTGSKDLAIRRLEHRIPSFIEIVAEPIQLDDPRMYGVLVDRPVDFGGPGEAQVIDPETLPTLGAPEVDLVDLDAGAMTNQSNVEQSQVIGVVQPLPSEASQANEPVAEDGNDASSFEAVSE